MTIPVKFTLLSSLAGLLIVVPCSGGPVSSLDDIEFWVGSGTNQAALLLDWDGESSTDQSLAWGYRWDGTATGEDMLLQILSADARLFAKTSAGGPIGIAVYGLGYDNDDDGVFAIDDGTLFDSNGIHVGEPPFCGTGWPRVHELS